MISRSVFIGLIGITFAIVYAYVSGQGTLIGEQRGASREGEQSFSGTMADLAELPGSHRCFAQSMAPGARTTGTVFVAGGQIRGDFESTAPGVAVSVKSHVIKSGALLYTWTDLAPRGFKARTSAAPTAGASAASAQQFDQNQLYTFTCHEATVSSSVFTPPYSVTFVSQ